MKQKKDIVINVEPFNVEVIHAGWDGFTLEFLHSMGQDQGFRRKRIRMTLKWWFISYLVKVIKRAYEKQKARFDEIGEESGFNK